MTRWSTGAGLMLGLIACAGETVQRPEPAVQPSALRRAVANLPEPDRSFIRQATGAHLTAIRLGQLAMERGSSEKVRQIGRELIDSHTALDDRLRDDARRQGIVLPIGRLTPPGEEEVARLSQLSGREFDREFLDAVQRLQDDTLRSFNHEAVNGRDASIRYLASQLIPDLSQRVRLVRQEMQRL
jgi:putative membrane protein